MTARSRSATEIPDCPGSRPAMRLRAAIGLALLTARHTGRMAWSCLERWSSCVLAALPLSSLEGLVVPTLYPSGPGLLERALHCWERFFVHLDGCLFILRRYDHYHFKSWSNYLYHPTMCVSISLE